MLKTPYRRVVQWIRLNHFWLPLLSMDCEKDTIHTEIEPMNKSSCSLEILVQITPSAPLLLSLIITE